MKFSESWLRTFVNPDLSSADLAHQLTMAGLEVDALESVAPPFDKVVVAQVRSVEKHPSADRLSICCVDVGAKEDLRVVCGAANVAAGVKVPCALLGAKLPTIEITQTTIRGVESNGMLCSAKELGLESDLDGLLLLPPDAVIGTDFRDYYELNDILFTLKLTPNRSDCLSVIGVAREVAAITVSTLKVDEPTSVDAEIKDQLIVDISDKNACPRYCGRLIRGINMHALSPVWVVRRLERCGIRSVNAVVDITNYVMLEMGQPLHAFDAATIKNGIHVRFAQAQEQIILLNGECVTLGPDTLVIADHDKVLALAGIMGGLESAVSDATVDIFLESAFFDPAVIAAKTRSFSFNSDSAHRFERGVDFASTRSALERATRLILDVCGGKVGPVTEEKGKLPQRTPIQLRVERLSRVLGVALDVRTVSPLLRRLQFSSVIENNVFFVTPHSYRFDLAIEEDLIEEVARLYGYDKIAVVHPVAELCMLSSAETETSVDALKSIFCAREYQEIVTYSFISSEWEKDFSPQRKPISLRNPISAQMDAMRSSLFPGLLGCLSFNLNRQQSRMRVFEVGRCFNDSQPGYAQTERVAGLCYGRAAPEQWGSDKRNIDIFDVKADIEAVCTPNVVRFESSSHPALHPGKSARIFINNVEAGCLGELHPKWQQKYDLALAPVLFEIDINVLNRRELPRFREISKFPWVRRDLAIIVADDVSAQTLLDGLLQEKAPFVVDIALFDTYRGKGIENGKKSLAFRVLLLDTQKTLTDDVVNKAIAQLREILEQKYNARLRE